LFFPNILKTPPPLFLFPPPPPAPPPPPYLAKTNDFTRII